MDESRYYDPDVDVNGNVTETSSSSSSLGDERMEAVVSPIQDIGFVGVLGRFGLLKSYCIVMIGVLHHISSCDLLALWGEASFEASLIVFSAAGGTYQADRNREILAASTLI